MTTSIDAAGLCGVPVPEVLAPAAEIVRRCFVFARGGAPFLSAPDGAALVEWLSAGVPAAMVCAAVEEVAVRRIARCTRTPFHLTDVDAPLRRRLRGQGRPQPAIELEPLPRALLARVEAAEQRLLERTLATLTGLAVEAPERRLPAALTIASHFFEELWLALGDEHPRLLAEAADELCELRNVVGADGFRRLCEERARMRLRKRHPALGVSQLVEVYGGA